MFGHDRRNCHTVPTSTTPPGYYPDYATQMYTCHCEINRRWVARGGAGHTVPEPQMPKTPYELACENDCKITETAECCICMEDLTEKNKVTTACGHQFHFGCVSHPTIVNCPMCRSIIKPEIKPSSIALPSNDELIALLTHEMAPRIYHHIEIAIGHMPTPPGEGGEPISRSLMLNFMSEAQRGLQAVRQMVDVMNS